MVAYREHAKEWGSNVLRVLFRVPDALSDHAEGVIHTHIRCLLQHMHQECSMLLTHAHTDQPLELHWDITEATPHPKNRDRAKTALWDAGFAENGLCEFDVLNDGKPYELTLYI